jgi:hypothetical protein
MKLPYRVLVLDDDEHALSGIVELLRDGGHHVTGAATYDAAKRLLAVSPFDLLISDVRLRSFTGYDDPLIDMEAHRYQAELVRKPIHPEEFQRTVTLALGKVRRQRRWPRKRVVGGFRVTIKGKPAAVVDVSYGGLRIELPEGERLPDSFDVEVAGIGLHLEVEPVWSSNASGDTSVRICGATLAAEHTPSARTWRAIVDRLNV